MTTIKELINQATFEIGDNGIQIPPNFYIKISNQVIQNIFNWLLTKNIYYKTEKEDIILLPNIQQYIIKVGKTIKIYKDNILLDKKPYEFSFEFNFTAEPEYYFETLTTIGFIPIPNATKTIQRYYISIPNEIIDINNSFSYPSLFERLFIVMFCLQSLIISEDIDWLKLKAELVPKWQKEQEDLQNNLLQIYKPISIKSKNLFD